MKTTKTAGKLLMAATLIFTVAVFVVSGFYSGETKAVEGYIDAIDRQDQIAFDKYSEKTLDVNTIRSEYIAKSGLDNSDEIDFKVTFPNGVTIKQGGDNFAVPINLTVYDDNTHFVFEDAIANVTYIGNKWRVFSIEL
ncbi:MAG: hypothetical protein LBM41_00110 [Ruminococcus sp.]|jgi:hypothetical protein|nr:hypothetical protein [Ruminococcus sp.]